MPSIAFTTSFDFATTTAIAYNKEWENGTGYLDHAVQGEHAPALKAGEMVKTITEKGRKVILVGTPVGNIVVFQRYTDNPEVYVFNAPTMVPRLYGSILASGRLSEEALELIVGNPQFPSVVPNIGRRMSEFLKDAQK